MAGEIKAKLQQQMKEALKGRQADRLAVLRMVLNEITATQVKDPSADELACVRAYHKKLTKARPEYEKVGAADHVAALDREIAVVEEFLPTAMPDSELEQAIEQIIRDRGFGPRDFGKAMKEILGQYGDRTEGGRVAAILKAKLAAHP